MDEVEIVDYDPAWPGRFEQEAARVRAALPEELVTRIEHFGSTSVPGLAAKPIIDLLIGVRSLHEACSVAVPALEALNYAFWYDNPRTDRLFFVRGLPPNGPRTHHIHIIADDSPDWERLLFRDYLRAHPGERDRYAQLKRDFAVQHREDREAYTEAKGVYVQEVTEKAKQERQEETGGDSMSNDALTTEPGAATQIPAELDIALDTDPAARARFDALAPSHRREYIRYVAEAARPDTRQRRAEKTIAMLREKAEAKTA